MYLRRILTACLSLADTYKTWRRPWESNPLTCSSQVYTLAGCCITGLPDLQTWRLVGVSIPLPLQWQCSALPIELTKHEFVLSCLPHNCNKAGVCLHTIYPIILHMQGRGSGGGGWSWTSSVRDGGFTVHWGYQFSYTSIKFALYIDGPYIFTIPFFGRSKGSLPRLNTLSDTSQAKFGTPYGNRTHLYNVKGCCPKPIDERSKYLFLLLCVSILAVYCTLWLNTRT